MNGRVSIIFGQWQRPENAMKLKLLANVCRIDKYYMLVRKFVNASFLLLVREEWSRSVCEEYNHIIGGPGGPL